MIRVISGWRERILPARDGTSTALPRLSVTVSFWAEDDPAARTARRLAAPIAIIINLRAFFRAFTFFFLEERPIIGDFPLKQKAPRRNPKLPIGTSDQAKYPGVAQNWRDKSTPDGWRGSGFFLGEEARVLGEEARRRLSGHGFSTEGREERRMSRSEFGDLRQQSTGVPRGKALLVAGPPGDT